MIYKNKDEGRKEIEELVEKFEREKEEFLNKSYSEYNTRLVLINPFFAALGWDIYKKENVAEAYRDVIHEDKIKIDGQTKAPDYCFTISGIHNKKFFVEAKKPSISIDTDLEPAYQVRRYGWSAKLPLSIVTDFEEFSVYDCTIKPSHKDNASIARRKYIKYNQYIDEFEYLWEYFSKEGVYTGRFDKYVASDTQKRGTSTVDKEFLKSLEEWRKLLALNIALRNPNLNEDEINYAVQQTIDRIIFLRICEDRKVEKFGELEKHLTSDNFYKNLFSYFKKADEKYNSGLFDFSKDEITSNLTIDNKTIKTIISDLYLPKCEYEFSVMPIEILGNAYEQFLGKVIRLTAGHQAKIEEKPEVRKAGGVYYTPQYIVDYIVKNTVGKLIEGKNPDDISKIKICDPACGSGSFLIGAYQYLLDYHMKYYFEHPKSTAKKKDNPLTPDGRLTTNEKKRILINNIFGVDIDPQAVEVTKLSLLLKAMEGETQASITTQLSLFNERILPTLENNIKCGNSLIGNDFYDSELELEPKEARKIKPFEWKTEFKDVFAQGGFDCVIGNPPWVDIKGLEPILVKYYFNNFKTAENRINLFALFVERSLHILKENGFFGYIVPNSILVQSSYSKIRTLILNKFYTNCIVRLPDNIFENVKAETCILIIEKKVAEEKDTEIILYDRKDSINFIFQDNCKKYFHQNQNNWEKNNLKIFNIFINDSIYNLLNKIELNSKPLEYFCDFSLGITPYDKYKGHTQTQIKDRIFHSTYKKDETFKELLSGEDIKRYFVEWGGKEYISYGNWLGASRRKEFFIGEKIFVRQIISGKPLRIYAAYTDKEYYITQIGFSIIKKTDIDLKFILGILNSSLMNFYHKNKYLDQSKDLFQKILIQDAKQFPIPEIDKSLHDEIVKNVDIMLSLNKELNETKLPDARTQLENRIKYTDNKIDSLVYKLYGLTDDEIKIVKGE